MSELCGRGASSPIDFRRLGYDAIDLATSPVFGGLLVERFGKIEVERAFVATPGDCLVVCGSPAQDLLCDDLGRLMDVCCGHAEESNTILNLYLGRWANVTPQTINGIRMQSPLARVSARSLLLAGVHFPACSSIVQSCARDVDTTGLTPPELFALGVPAVTFGGLLG